MSKLFKNAKSVLYIWLIGLIIFIVTLIAGAILFPGHYTILKNYISDLGNPTLTPYYWLITIGLLTLGAVSLIAMIRIIFQLKKNKTSFSALFLNIFACIGIFGVAIINESMGYLHSVFAMFIFGGFTLGSAVMGQAAVSSSLFEKPLSKRNFRIFGIIIFLALLALEVASVSLFNAIGSMSFEEWMCLICFLTYLLFLTLESTMSPITNFK